MEEDVEDRDQGQCQGVVDDQGRGLIQDLKVEADRCLEVAEDGQDHDPRLDVEVAIKKGTNHR